MFRNTKRRLALWLPATLIITSLLAACGDTGAGEATGSAPAGEPSAAASAAASPNASPIPDTGAGSGDTLTVYSGRNEELIGALMQRYQEETGATLNIKYGDTAELAATILEEGDNSPADIFFAQDAGALGALDEAGRLAKLPDELLGQVDERFRSPDGDWVGVSGRARVVVYNTAALTETDLPADVFGFTAPEWKGRLGWAPTNGSFQSFVTALRVLEGEDRAREWLEGIKANEPKVYDNNTAIVKAVAAGEVDAGFVNHYYLYRQLKEQGPSFGARNYYLKNGDPGALVNVAGAAILNTSEQQAAAARFIEFLLSEEAQTYFAEQTYEYPLVAGIDPDVDLPTIESIQAPQMDLSRLDDLQGTLRLLQDLGIL